MKNKKDKIMEEIGYIYNEADYVDDLTSNFSDRNTTALAILVVAKALVALIKSLTILFERNLDEK